MYGAGAISRNSRYWEYLHIAECFDNADTFDLIQNNMNFLPFHFALHTKTPIVTTVHSGLVEFDTNPLVLDIYKKYNVSNTYVSISNAARHSELDYAATIYHGVNPQEYIFEALPGKYLLFFGRISRDKGATDAIRVAKRFGMKLILAGIVPDKDYFEKNVKAHVDGVNVEYIGAVAGSQKKTLLAQAYALLHLIHFPEPFGFSVIESLASGTPVIAFNKGALPEIITSGKNGYIVETEDEAVEKLAWVPYLDRSECRATVIAKFTVERMIDDYGGLFEKIVQNAVDQTQSQ